MLARLQRLLTRPARPGRTLYFAILAQARAPAFYRSYGVPDTVDGRFDLVVLHAALVFRRLRALGQAAGSLADDTFEVMTADLDRSVRELGGGDLGAGKRVKAMARAFYGRADAYEHALAGGEDALAVVVRRNIYGGAAVHPEQLERMVGYVRAAAMTLESTFLEALAAGRPGFPDPAG